MPFRPTLSIALLLTLAAPAAADLLDPNAFASLGAFPSAAVQGSLIYNTEATTPTITYQDGGGTYHTISGVVSSGVAVFTFDSINLVGSGSLGIDQNQRTPGLPLALLSRGSIRIDGSINVSSNMSSSPGSQGSGPTVGGSNLFAGGGGGGSGGAGGQGGGQDGSPGGSAVTVDLAHRLQGGGAGGWNLAPNGGGALELGALSSITITGQIYGNGGTDLSLQGEEGHAGGAGGGILIHAPTVDISGQILAYGGDGGRDVDNPGMSGGSGGGGGGGQVYIQTGPGGYSQSGTIDVAGGHGVHDNNFPIHNSQDGQVGVITIEAVPEPSSIALLGLGALAALGLARRRRPAA